MHLSHVQRRALPASQLGTSQPAFVQPPIAHPNEAPCVVTLFSNMQFINNYSVNPFSYTPSCPGPWATVVFSADFNVTKGRQFDRTANVWLAGTNLYFGTTAEPRANLSPSWHVERDVTQLSSIFGSASTGGVYLGNTVDSTYTGIDSMSAKLLFYPATTKYPAPVTADAVEPLSASSTGGSVNLSSPSDVLSGTFTLPQNIERAYLDVVLQSQGGDEFWYTCFPNALAAKLANCGNTAFREGEVTVDGLPAGVAPIYPYIYTGGIDPYLWEPIAGVDTFDLGPYYDDYRVDLTPFAGLLSNGSSHTIAVSVYNNDNYFSTTGTLLLYEDHGSSTVTGGLVSDNIPPSPSVSVRNRVRFDSSGNAKGPVTVTASHPVMVDGYVNTSHGRIETRVAQQISFSNAQQIRATADGNTFVQNIDQLTTIDKTTTVTNGSGKVGWVKTRVRWPLTLDYAFNVLSNGNATQATTVSQGKTVTVNGYNGIGPKLPIELSNNVNSTDTLTFLPDGTYTHGGAQSEQRFTLNTHRRPCYSRTLRSKNNQLMSVTQSAC